MVLSFMCEGTSTMIIDLEIDEAKASWIQPLNDELDKLGPVISLQKDALMRVAAAVMMLAGSAEKTRIADTRTVVEAFHEMADLAQRVSDGSRAVAKAAESLLPEVN